ncbi:GAF and ANTAR domain-containing protein [Agromyces sp. NPDC058484]|uniref:GAF and ANTAR domain-containing protein n=1 Tax=Agromyces sp. NPDC058484 TaxID=3346524 RepID=UPI00364B46FE
MIDDGAGTRADPGGAPSPGAELCSRFVELLPVTGVSISAIGAPGQSTIGASDTVAARLEELQFELGEGPHWEALRSGQAVLVPDVGERDHSWPVFGAAVLELGVGALFAFPLVMGAVTVGVVDMYRSAPGKLDAREIATAHSLAASTAGTALRLAARSAGEDSPARGGMGPELRREVHQATGMVLVQLQVTATEAFARLQAHAFSTGQTVELVAHAVVTRRLRFLIDGVEEA